MQASLVVLPLFDSRRKKAIAKGKNLGMQTMNFYCSRKNTMALRSLRIKRQAFHETKCRSPRKKLLSI